MSDLDLINAFIWILLYDLHKINIKIIYIYNWISYNYELELQI